MEGTLGVEGGEWLVELKKPIQAELDLNPSVSNLVLKQINPFLGFVTSPSVSSEKKSQKKNRDVSISIWPRNGIFPNEEFEIKIDPMVVAVKEGSFLEEILSFVLQRKLPPSSLSMQTSSVRANYDGNGTVNCKRMDVLMAGGVHLAFWGEANSSGGPLHMVFAISESTLYNFFGVKSSSKSYFLQVPVSGTFENPKIDLGRLGLKIAEIALQQKLGIPSFRLVENKNFSEVPKPIDPLPWEFKVSNPP